MSEFSEIVNKPGTYCLRRDDWVNGEFVEVSMGETLNPTMKFYHLFSVHEFFIKPRCVNTPGILFTALAYLHKWELLSFES